MADTSSTVSVALGTLLQHYSQRRNCDRMLREGFQVFENVAGGTHVVVLLVIAVLELGTLVVLWRDLTRSQLAKVVWTVVIAVLPILGALGFLVNWALGRLADRLNRAR